MTQFELLSWRRRGGWRPGAGRKRTSRNVPHAPRPPFKKGVSHVTLRRRRDLPSLRREQVVRAIVQTWSNARERGDFRLLHFSIQSDHVHVIVEADHADALGRGVKALGIRLAKAANRVWKRTGAVIADRYHTHRLRSPLEMRRALVYVLQNFRKHGGGRAGHLDPASSARYFDGWALKSFVPATSPPVARPRNWLAGKGWLRLGRIRLGEAPA